MPVALTVGFRQLRPRSLPSAALPAKPQGYRTYFASATTGKPRLVILGSGWGGYEVLRAVDKKRWSKSSLARSDRGVLWLDSSRPRGQF